MRLKNMALFIAMIAVSQVFSQIVNITGTVTGPDGKPVAGAAITLSAQNLSATTGLDGTYSITQSSVLMPHFQGNNFLPVVRFSENSFSFAIPKDNQHVRIEAYSLDGRLIHTAVNTQLNRGTYAFPIFEKPGSSQMFLISFQVNDKSKIYKYLPIANRCGNFADKGYATETSAQHETPGPALKKAPTSDTLKAVKKGFKRASKAITSSIGTYDFALAAASYIVKVGTWGIVNSWIYVQSGDSVNITATGTWYNTSAGNVGPAGGTSTVNGLKQGALAVRVGKYYERYSVGNALNLKAPRAGYLWFFMNSDLGNYNEKSGSLTVTINGGDSGVGIRPEGMVKPIEDPTFNNGLINDTFARLDTLIPVYFETDAPNDPIVKAYIDTGLGGDPVAYLHKMVRTGCAIHYNSWANFPAAYKTRYMRIVHYIGAQSWDSLGRPAYQRGGHTYWDFALSFKPAELSDFQNYGHWGCVPTVLNHETGHVLAPDGVLSNNTVPRWIQETFADQVAYYNSDYIFVQDNPETGFFARIIPYCDGYATGAPFMDWINFAYPGFHFQLSNYIINLGNTPYSGSATVFKALTGKDIATLYAEYLAYYNLTLNKPVAQCNFPEP
jgi:hypothetical protein